MKVNKEDKWLLVSCLQKSIRKGFKELALNYADKLYEIERGYLLYRLSIIAIEDVGLGNIDLIHDFLSTEIRKANIEERGGKDYVMKVVEYLASSVKDRSACDLTSLASFYQNETENQTPEQVFLNKNESVANRALAGWKIIGGKKHKNNLVGLEDQHDFEKFLDLNEKIVNNKKIIEILKFSNTVHREPHFIAFGLLYSLYESELAEKLKMGKYVTGQSVEKQFPITLVQNKWLIDGIDWHTKEGKGAVFEFAKDNNELVKHLKTMVIDSETITALIGMLLFRQNGHQVDKRLFYPTSVANLKMTQKLTFQSMVNNNAADFAHAMKLLEESTPLLNEKIEKQFTTANPKYFPF